MKIKPGVSILGIRPEMLVALEVANDVYKDHDCDLVVTSCTDGTHSRGSRHYSGLAIDIRTRNLVESEIPQVHQRIRDDLGSSFDVILESTHIHIEFDPE